jgi:hypothetical protein
MAFADYSSGHLRGSTSLLPLWHSNERTGAAQEPQSLQMVVSAPIIQRWQPGRGVLLVIAQSQPLGRQRARSKTDRAPGGSCLRQGTHRWQAGQSVLLLIAPPRADSQCAISVEEVQTQGEFRSNIRQTFAAAAEVCRFRSSIHRVDE